MSLITRCPACGTMFKVVPDQLKISEGWVRCGHCTEIFDATTQLKSEPGTAAPTLPATHATSDAQTAGAAHSSSQSEAAFASPLEIEAGENLSSTVPDAV